MPSSLATLLDLLRSEVTNPQDYSGVMREVAFEVMDADAFIAGIATSLLDGEKVDATCFDGVRRPFLVDVMGADGRFSRRVARA